MWTPVAFLVVLAAATSAEYGFKVGTQYKYEVTSKTLTSLQQVGQQYAGVFIRAQLTVTPVQGDELIAYISQPEKAQIHTTVTTGSEFDVPQNVVQYTPFTLSQEPFVIKLKDGTVDELVVSKDLPIWEVNIIRSIVSQLQIDTQGRRIIPSKLNTVPQGQENTAVYKVMEDTVEGDCEVLYDITPLPKYILQRMQYLAPYYQGQEELIDIVKTKNFSNCEQRPGYHFGFTELTDMEPTTNKMGNFLSRSSVSRVVVSGTLKSYTIQSSVTTNKVILSPEVYNNQKGEVVSRVNLTLTSVQSGSQTGSQTPQGPKNPQTLQTLVYDFNSPFINDVQAREKWDNRQEQTTFKPTRTNTVVDQLRGRRSFDDETMILSNNGRYQETPTLNQAPETPFLPYFVGYQGHSIQHSKDVNVNQVVRKLAEQIGQYLQDQTQISKANVLDRYSILVEIIRTMNVKQLEQTVQEIYTPEQETTQSVSDTRRNTWMTFRDALAQAGTGPALVTIVNLITTHKIKEEEAAQVVTTLPETARYPTTEYLNTFFELIKNPEVVSQKHLNASSIYAFTKLVRYAQVNQKSVHNRYPVHAFGYLVPQDDTTVTDTYIPYFAQQLEQAVGQEDSHKIQTYIRALGNIAHPKIVEVFEPYLEGTKPMTDFQRTLIVVSLNKLAMVYPTLARSVLYKIYANTGEVYQVRVAAVYNLMKTNPPGSMLQRMAQFTHEDPSYQVRSAVKSAIESAALLVTKENNELRQNAQSAVNMLVPTVFGVQYSRTNLTDYLVKGLHLGYTQTVQYTGSEDSLIPKSFLYKVIGNINGYENTLLKVTGMISSVQNFYDLLQDIFIFDEEQQTGETTETSGQTFTLDKINKILNIEHIVKEQVEGNFAIKFGTLQRFFAFDNHTIESLPEIINKFSQLLAKGKVYNYQKMFSQYQITIGLPTATGLPFFYSLKTPTYVGIKGKVQAQIPELQTTERGTQIPKGAQVTSNVEVVFATNKKGQIGFVTPFDHQRYVAGYKKQIQVNLPIKGSIVVDVTKQTVQVEIKPTDKQDYKFVHYSTKPFTAVQDVLEFKPVTECSTVKIITTKPLKEIVHQYGQDYFGVGVRISGQSEKTNLDLKKIIYDFIYRHDYVSGILYPTVETYIGNTEVGLYYDTKVSTAQTISLTFTYREIKPTEDLKHETDTGKVFVPTQDSQTRVEQFSKQASAGISKTTVYVTDLGLKIQGGKPVEYVGTVACATSVVDSQTKVLGYLHKTMGGENYEVCFNGIVKDTYVSTVDYEKVTQGEPRSEVNFQLQFGGKCESGAKIDVTGKLERSQERREYLQTLPQVQQCKTEIQQGSKFLAGCRNATLQAGLMDKYRFTVKYHEVPENVQNVTYQIYSVLRHFGYPYVTESITTTTEKTTQNQQIELDVNFSPDLTSANIYISTPNGVAQFRNVYVNKYARTVFVVHPVYNIVKRLGWSTLQQQYDAYCVLDKVQAKTFDNQTYSTNLGNVWHVMSISVPKVNNEGKYGNVYDFSVLVRENSNNQKEVQFVFDYPRSTVVRVSPSQGQTHGNVFVNEKQVQFDNKGYYEYNNGEHTVLQVYVLPTGELKIVHPDHGFEFVYDQTRVQLILSQEYRNRVGGLCGVYNGEQFDFVTPQGYILKNPEEFTASWALSNEGRVGELKKKAQEHSIYKKTVTLTNVVGTQDTGNTGTYGRQQEGGFGGNYKTYGYEETEGVNPCTVKRIMVIETDGKHCFSVHPQTTCKPGCQVEKTKTVNTEFVCVNKTQTSSHWAQMVARGAQPNLRNKGNTQTMQFESPEVCTKA